MTSGKIKESVPNDGRLLPLSSDLYAKNTSENMVGNPNYNWQCFNTLIFSGPSRVDQGMVSITAADGGGFSKSQHVSLVLSRPFTTTLREKLHFESIVQSSSSGGVIDPMSKVWLLQRQARLSVIESQIEYSNLNKPSEFSHVIIKRSEKDKSNIHPIPPGCVGITTAPKESVVVNRKLFNRQRKIIRKENKAQERDERKRRMDAEEKRKKQNKLFFDTVLSHRDVFYRHHRQVKVAMLRLAKSVSLKSEQLNLRKERDEAKEEMMRLQALKQNDMAAYTKLVQETKNTRLKFLLNQTDTYVSVINKMVLDQRAAQEGEEEGAEQSEASKPGKADASNNLFGLNSTSTKTSSDYLINTHNKVEKVSQPTMMRGGQLKEYQLSGLQWLVSLYNNNLNGILADEMGLGKTIQTIALLTYVMEFKKNMGPFLIVVPLSTLSNWVNEATKWAPDMIKVIYKGIPQVRKQIYKDEIEPGRFNLLLTTYEYIMKDKHALRKLQWQYIIVDEGHRMKNANSKFAQTLGTMFSSKHRVLLTGTPLQNNLPELWSLLNFLLPTIFSSVDTFDQWFNKPFASFRGQANAVPDATAEDTTLSQEERLLIVHRLHEVLRPFMLRRIKSQVLDQLPEKVEKVVHCELSGWQRKIYKVIHQRSIASKEGTGVGGMNNVIMHLRKICNHPYLFLNDWYVDEDLIRSAGKFELLDRMLPKLKAGGHRVLMFSQMTQAMTILEKYFEYRGFISVRLDGSTSSDEREKRVAMFNDPESPHFIFLLSTRAGGLGLNLATADTVIIFDSDWNPMMDAQAQDRAHRIGQKKEVRVYRLVTNTLVEEKILSRAADKKNLNGLVVEAGKFTSSSDQGGSQGNREMMESLLKEWSAGGDGIVQDDEDGENGTEMPDDEQLNELMALNDAEVELYRSIDRAREEKRVADWVQMNARRGIAASANSCPKRLMEEHEQPSWLNPSSFSTKNALLGQQIMGVMGITKGSIKQADGSFSQGYAVDEENYDDGVNFVGGKAMRKRKDIMYDDHMTELQFQRMVEKQAHEDDKQQKLQKKANAASNVDKMRTSGLSEDEAKTSMQVIKEVKKIIKSDGYPLAQPFLEPPDKKLYPDYYFVVKNVVSFKDVLGKLKKGAYGSVDDIGKDFTLMAENARLYNQDTSQIAVDAERVCDEFFKRMFAQGLVSKVPLREFSSSSSNYSLEVSAPTNKRSRDEQPKLVLSLSTGKSSYQSSYQEEQLDVSATSFRIRKKKKFD